MSKRLICAIQSNSTTYEVVIQKDLLNDQTTLKEILKPFGNRFAIITDDNIVSLYGQQLCSSLLCTGLETFIFSFPSGEEHKTRATKEILENQLFEKELGRDTCIIALGGGVVTDMGGYLASTYCRGVSLIMIPTSLLGMVDASIGGKNGVNVPHGKNMIGSVYQPKKILIDPLTLRSLPLAELKNGIVEMIKHGIVADGIFFNYLEGQVDQLMTLDELVVENAIFESLRIKKEIVELDERENGKRYLLNFGHTFGHALEKILQYKIAHGEAVAIGILVEAYLAYQLKALSKSSFDRIKKILIKYALPLKPPSRCSTQQFLDAMRMDKKSLGGIPRFVIINEIGSPLTYGSTYCTHVEDDKIRNVIMWINNDMRCH